MELPIPLQKAFDFEAGQKRDDALRSALAAYRLPHWSVELIVMMARDGRPREVKSHRCFELTISKRKAARVMGCSGNTFTAAAARLQQLGVLGIVCLGRSYTYVLNRDLLAELAPIGDDVLDDLPLFDPPGGQQVVSSGQQWSAVVSAPRAVENKKSLSRGSCRERVREREHVTRGPTDQPLTTADQRSPELPSGQPRPAAGSAVTLRSLTDEDFRPMDGLRLQAALADCIGQRWLRDEHEDHRKFWALCRHAAYSDGIAYPARFVYSKIKHHDFQTVNQEHWDWAGRFLKQEEANA